MPVFPSIEWFQALAAIVNEDPEYKHQGTVDAKVGLGVDGQLYELTFEAYSVTGVRELKPSDERDLDFTLALPLERWQDMLENIKANGQADLSHTLNSIDLTVDGFATSDDGYRLDLFYRFNQSFQIYFDDSVKLQTTYAPTPVGA